MSAKGAGDRLMRVGCHVGVRRLRDGTGRPSRREAVRGFLVGLDARPLPADRDRGRSRTHAGLADRSQTMSSGFTRWSYSSAVR